MRLGAALRRRATSARSHNGRDHQPPGLPAARAYAAS